MLLFPDSLTLSSPSTRSTNLRGFDSRALCYVLHLIAVLSVGVRDIWLIGVLVSLVSFIACVWACEELLLSLSLSLLMPP